MAIEIRIDYLSETKKLYDRFAQEETGRILPEIGFPETRYCTFREDHKFQKKG